jgi:hypothetical protein
MSSENNLKFTPACETQTLHPGRQPLRVLNARMAQTAHDQQTNAQEQKATQSSIETKNIEFKLLAHV